MKAGAVATPEAFAATVELEAKVPLAPLPMAGLLAVSAGLGLIGAFLCVQRHLARLN